MMVDLNVIITKMAYSTKKSQVKYRCLENLKILFEAFLM